MDWCEKWKACQKEAVEEVELSCWPLLVLILFFCGLDTTPAFASFFFSSFIILLFLIITSPWTFDNGARGAVLAFVVTTLEQAALLVTSPSRFSFRKLCKDLGRNSRLLSSLKVSFLFQRLQDNHKGTVNSSNQTMFPKYYKRTSGCTLIQFLWTCFICKFSLRSDQICLFIFRK